MKKTVLITGASKGIGRQTARLFASEGFNVIINYYKSEHEAKALAQELDNGSGNVMLVKADVASSQQVAGMVEQAISRYKKIDVLVNNAGIAQQKVFSDITADDWDRMFDVNVGGMFHCTKAVANDMIKNKSGRIINVSSVWGITGASCEVHYSASKAAVIGFTKALAKELGPSQIQVNCVAPGVIDTDMNSDLDADTIIELKSQTPLGVIGRADDIANTILFLASDAASYITGQVISPNGGFLI